MYDYIPGIRHGTNEQQALEALSNQLSQAGGSQQQHSDRVKPLLEIVTKSDLNMVSRYVRNFSEVFVDFPRYLSYRDNKYRDDVDSLIRNFWNDPVTFHQLNSGMSYTPTLSGTIDPIDLSNYKAMIQTLHSYFNRICIRLFIPINTYSSSQENTIREILNELGTNDAVLADALNVDNLSTGLMPNIEFISNEMGAQDFYVFNLFEPRDGVNYNYGPVIGKHAGVDGVGDYVLERRFPSDIPPGAFPNIPKRVRQYESTSHSLDTTEDPDYYVNAIGSMVRSGNLNPNHCQACQDLYDEFQMVTSTANRIDLDAGFVKRMRMNHYMYSVLNDEFPNMDAASSASNFDSRGYNEIT
ncbi:hypothetical protein [Halococcus sp. IIIV-5B]|uniref:hypothetical protein n=1 Tax=Halococcus sp. IIIV-5B TaxID=2321230 RepID=UPI0011C34AE7|nr:hypothetical protein [Halococcus sp. IIIV-5B]